MAQVLEMVLELVTVQVMLPLQPLPLLRLHLLLLLRPLLLRLRLLLLLQPRVQRLVTVEGAGGVVVAGEADEVDEGAITAALRVKTEMWDVRETVRHHAGCCSLLSFS